MTSRWCEAGGVLCCFLLLVGCVGGGEPAGPRKAIVDVQPETLRRLSADEVVNTLDDLFPGLNLESATSLPSDPTNNGFSNDAESLGVSQLHIRRLERIAHEVGEAATSERYLSRVLPCDVWETVAQQDACMDAFVTAFLPRALRGRVDDEFSTLLRTRMDLWRDRVDFRGAIHLAIVTTLLAPEFIYRMEPVGASDEVIEVDAYALAVRLSYALWGTMPDAALFAAASDGSILQDEVLEANARRMLDDPRGERQWVRFHSAWLGLDEILLAEHAVRFDWEDWNEATQQDALKEVERFLAHTFDNEPTLSTMLTSRTAFVNAPLAALYDVSAPVGSEWREVELPAERAGLLSRIAILAARSHAAYGSPPLRGNFVRTRFLCGPHLNPPPDADLSQPLPSEGAEPRTNRQLFEERAEPAVCQSCHVELDGLGFGLENFDAAGRFRLREEGLPIDARGLLLGTDVDGPYDGAVELSERLAQSVQVQRCYVQRALQNTYGRVFDADEPMVGDLAARFFHTGGDARELLVQIVTHPRFRVQSGRSR